MTAVQDLISPNLRLLEPPVQRFALREALNECIGPLSKEDKERFIYKLLNPPTIVLESPKEQEFTSLDGNRKFNSITYPINISANADLEDVFANGRAEYLLPRIKAILAQANKFAPERSELILFSDSDQKERGREKDGIVAAQNSQLSDFKSAGLKFAGVIPALILFSRLLFKAENAGLSLAGSLHTPTSIGTWNKEASLQEYRRLQAHDLKKDFVLEPNEIKLLFMAKEGRIRVQECLIGIDENSIITLDARLLDYPAKGTYALGERAK